VHRGITVHWTVFWYLPQKAIHVVNPLSKKLFWYWFGSIWKPHTFKCLQQEGWIVIKCSNYLKIKNVRCFVLESWLKVGKVTTWYLLIHWLRYLNQETAKWPFPSSSQAAICYHQSNHSKVDAIPLNALPKNTTSELADPVNAKR